jgi:hypothetical protein
VLQYAVVVVVLCEMEDECHGGRGHQCMGGVSVGSFVFDLCSIFFDLRSKMIELCNGCFFVKFFKHKNHNNHNKQHVSHVSSR